MEVPLRPCALNSTLAASSRRERMLWPAVRVARALWRGAGAPLGRGREPFRTRAPRALLPSSLTLANRAPFRSGADLVCITYKQDGSKSLFGEGYRLAGGTTSTMLLVPASRPSACTRERHD